MSTAKTEHYQLHQWGGEDEAPEVERELNENFATLDAAVAEAKETAAELPYVFGKYTGTGMGQRIVLGFQPALVIIYEHQLTSDASAAVGKISIYTEKENAAKLSLMDDGILLYSDDFCSYPAVNKKGQQYIYFAFR
jgi:hypothetical protein